MSDKERPLVSIHMITYNHEKYIGKAIEGVLLQKTNFKIELIIGEDCSPDGTAEVVREYADKYPELIVPVVRQKNVGIAKNVTDIYDRCRGKYIAICEGDDYWIDPLKLQKQVDFLEDNEDYGLVHTDFEIVNETDTRDSRRKNKKMPKGSLFENVLMGQYSIGALTVLFRADIYNKIPKYYLQKSFPMFDSPMWIEMSKITKFKYLPDVTSAYRRLDDSASHSVDMDKIIEWKKSKHDVRLFYINKYNVGIGEKELLFRLYSEIVGGAYIHQESKIAKVYYKKLLKTDFWRALNLKIVLFYLGARFKSFDKIINWLYKKL